MSDTPRSFSQLPHAFDVVGEPGWVSRTRAVLATFGVPEPVPCTERELAEVEARLGLPLPPVLRTILRELGPAAFDGIKFLPSAQIDMIRAPLGYEYFSPTDRAMLPNLAAVAEYCGENIGIDLRDGQCCLVGHDPPGLSNWLSSASDLLRLAVLSLASGREGWPDREVAELVSDAERRLFGTRYT